MNCFLACVWALMERIDVKKSNLNVVFMFELRPTNDKIQKLEGFATLLKYKNNSKKHWSDLLKWDMAIILCDIVMCKMKKIISVFKFIPIFIDGVLQLTTIIGSRSMYM
jgi:hypothetical protein